jgi:arylsulfatase A-like enzyme
VLRWLDGARPSERPLFLYVHYMDPHEPYLSREPFAGTFSTPGVEPIHVLPSPVPDLLPFDALPPEGRTPEEIVGRVDAYDACILQNDSAVGELVAELERRGLWRDSVFVLVADHGEEFLDHGGWGHGQSVYQEQIHVPLILRLPGGKHGGAVVEEGVMLVDVFLTLARLARIEPPDGTEGIDLLARIGAPDAQPRPAFAESFVGTSSQRAVVRERWKWIRARREDREAELLFDLTVDPGEEVDLMTSAPTPGVYQMAADLAGVAEQTLSTGARSRTTELEEGVRRQLEELGYVE